MLTPTLPAPLESHPDPALRLKPAALYLGKKSPRTVRRYIDLGLLTPVVLGSGQIAVRKSELDRFLSGDADKPLPARKVERARDERGRMIKRAKA
jgi:hypothetical protein